MDVLSMISFSEPVKSTLNTISVTNKLCSQIIEQGLFGIERSTKAHQDGTEGSGYNSIGRKNLIELREAIHFPNYAQKKTLNTISVKGFFVASARIELPPERPLRVFGGIDLNGSGRAGVSKV